AHMRDFEVHAIDRDGLLTPTGMTSELAPFGTRTQLYKGVRIKATQTVSVAYSATFSWTPRTPVGVMNGVKIDTDGGLVLGPCPFSRGKKLPVSFFDMELAVTPPGGHLQPIPLILGPNWQPNDVRIMFISAAGANQDIPLTLPMTPDPPTGFSAPYSI